jgi:hypothetical protein
MTSLLTWLLPVAIGATTTGDGAAPRKPTSVHDFVVDTIDGKPVRLSSYAGHVLLIVNVASK